MTSRRQAEQALRESEERFRTLVEQAPVGICITDERGNFETVNPAYCALYGYTPEELIGRHFTMVTIEARRADLIRLYARHLAARTVARRETEVITKQGRPLTVLATMVPITGPDGGPKIAHFVIDITGRKRAETRLSHLAHHDALTGLPNRTLFRDRLSHALAQARRRGQLVALLFLDMDGFKAINDTLGHHAGDLTLRAIGRRLSDCTRATDTVARLSGDEFTVILPDAGSGDNAAAIARKILDQLALGFIVEGHEVVVTASIGISLYPFDGQDVQSLSRNADAAMYRAKKQGKNTYAGRE